MDSTQPIAQPSKFERGLLAIVSHPRLGLWLALTGILLSSSALFMGFYLDDFVGRYIYSSLEGAKHLFDLYAGGYGLTNGNPADTHWQIEHGWAPWWTDEKLLIRLFRPLGIASHRLDFLLWPQSALLMHLHSLLWLALLLFATTRMYRGAEGTVVGGLAALMFALDHTHGFVVGYICNRHTLITALLGVICLDFHLRARSSERQAWPLLGYALYALTLASGESALAILCYLLAHALCVERAPLLRRLSIIAPYLVITVLWRAWYTRAGFGAFGSGLYIDPGRDPAAFVLALIQRAPLLLLGQFLAPPSELYSVWPEAWARATLVLAFVFTAALALGLAPLLRRNRNAWFWLLGALGSIAPAASTYPHNRQLLFTSFGAMALLAQLWEMYAIELRELRLSLLQRFSREQSGLLIFVRLFISPLVMPLTTYGIAISAPLLQAPASIGDDIAGHDAVFVTAPDYFAVKLVQLDRRIDQRPLPRRIRALGFGSEPTTIHRTAADTLELEYAGGILSTPFMELYRDRRTPMHVGDRVELEGMSIEVVEVTADRRASKARFVFDRDVDAGQFQFYYWVNGHFERLALPALGSSRQLPAALLELKF